MMADSYNWEERHKRAQPPPARIFPLPPTQTVEGVSSYGAKALQEELHTLANTPKGGRNHQLNKSAFNLAQLVAAGHLERVSTQQQLRATALTIGLTASETDATLRSAFNAGAQQPRIVPEPEVGYTVEEVSADDLSAQKSFWNSREILSHIQQFAYSRMISPWSLLGVSMLRMLACIPPHVVLPPLIGGYGSLNLFVALVGPSGVGKGASESAAHDCIDYCTDIYTAPVGSGEGIAHQYAHRERNGIVRDRDSVLFEVSEVDTLTALGNRQGSTLLSQLRSAFSGERLGFGYADATRRIPIERHTYRLGMTIGIQPEKAAPIIYDADGGTPQRLVWMPATDPDIDANPPAAPAQCVIPMATWGLPLNWHVLNVPEAVAKIVRENHAARARGEGDALNAHALFARLKVTQALSLLDRRREMTEDDWELSGVVMRMSDITRGRVIGVLRSKEKAVDYARAEKEASRAVRVAESVEEAAVKRVAGRVRQKVAEKGDVARSDVRRAIALRDREYFDDAVDRLVSAGQMVVEEGPHGAHLKIITDK